MALAALLTAWAAAVPRLGLAYPGLPDFAAESSLAWACGGYANLSALAAPHDSATAGEVLLIFSGRLALVETVAPHLLWLRRGPLFDRDARSGSVALSPSRLPGASFAHTTSFKLEHDLEQFEYLAARGWRSEWLRGVVIPGYREVLRRAAAHRSEDGYYRLSMIDTALVGATYNRALYFAPGDGWLPGQRIPAGALSRAVAWDRADRQYAEGRGLAVVYVDDALQREALEALLEYTRSATVFFESKAYGAGGHLGAYVFDGFAPPLLFQVAEELAAVLPRALGDHAIRNMWCYKYSPGESGIKVHTDQARVNVNLWLGPDDGNLEPDRGGLKIFSDNGTLAMEPSITPSDLLGAAGAARLTLLPNVIVPHRQNRLTIFDSSLPHASDVGAWRTGYAQRRTSLTFLFGEPRPTTSQQQ